MADNDDDDDSDVMSLEEFLAEAEPTNKQIERVEKVANTSTGMLLALAQFLADVEDEIGSVMVKEFAIRFADHERKTL